MLKENTRIAWRLKDNLGLDQNQGYLEGYIKEINGKMLSIADSAYGIRQWINSEEIEIEILEKTS